MLQNIEQNIERKRKSLDENYLWWDNEELLREERSREEWPRPGRLP